MLLLTAGRDAVTHEKPKTASLMHTTHTRRLLPVVPLVVGAATGGVVAGALESPHLAMVTVIVSFAMWAAGMGLSLLLLGLYLHRLMVRARAR